MNVDGLLYLMGMPILIVTLALLGVNLAIYLGDGMTITGLIWNYAKYIVATFLIPPLTGILTLILDKRPVKPMVKGILCYPIFMGSWILINIKATIIYLKKARKCVILITNSRVLCLITSVVYT